METIRKTISNEIRKWNSIDMQLLVINDRISSCYNILIIGDYDSKKNFFNILHYLKMKRDYIYLKIYNNNIKKISIFIDEAGFYELVFKSRLPAAKMFREWVFTKVLPSIRKYGYYKMIDSRIKQRVIIDGKNLQT